MASTQISAHISADTKAELEAYARRHGLKKAHVIEQALQHHLQALKEIPDDVLIPARLVLSEASFASVAERLAADEQPSEALRELMKR